MKNCLFLLLLFFSQAGSSSEIKLGETSKDNCENIIYYLTPSSYDLIFLFCVDNCLSREEMGIPSTCQAPLSFYCQEMSTIAQAGMLDKYNECMKKE